MIPEAALEMQIERYRAMTGEQRLKIALDLHALTLDIAREGIRHMFPGASEDEVNERLKERLRLVCQEAPRKYCWSSEYNVSLPLANAPG